MSILNRKKLISVPAGDDPRSTVSIRDLSGGQNTRQDPQNLPENQAETLTNTDISVLGQRKVRPGLTEIDEITSVTLPSLFAFEPIGGTNELQTVILSGSDTAVYQWNLSGDFAAISGTANIIDSDLPTAIKVFKTGGDGDVVLWGSQTKNWHEIKQDDTVTDLGNTQATGTDDPPRSNVAAFFDGRMWVLADNLLSYSDAYPSDYSGSFDTQAAGSAYNMPVGTERFLIGIRGKGLVCGGNDNIRFVTPSTVPAADDVTGLLVKDGCVANRSAVLAGDDILYLAKDGVRGVFKTQFDTLQYKTSLPVSYPLKDEFDLINWAQVTKASAVYYDNKYFLSLPVSSSETNNRVWVYFPASNGWMIITGWNVSDWAVLQVNGEDRLYATDATDGTVYQAWKGSSDNGTDIEYDEVSRKLNLGTEFEKKIQGEIMVRVKATGQYTVSVYASFDEGSFEKLGDILTEDRTVNFAAWTFPMNFQEAGIYTEKFHIDQYGEWYQMQIELKSTSSSGDDLTVLQSSLLGKVAKYLSEEN
jgi:hypothetical protein